MTLPAVQLVPWRGRQLAVRRAGAGPTLVLIHGMAGSLTTWDPVFADLARVHDVIALDLPGHGASSASRDYTLGSMAGSVRDLLDSLDVETATVVGHSLGGGIAMQFMYQFPERCERLVLVSSGGLGREVTPMLRALTMPGADLALAGGARIRHQPQVAAVARLMRPVAGRLFNDLPYMLRQMATLDEPEKRRSFLATINAVIELGGQGINAVEKLHLAAGLPTLIVWGEDDRMIPSGHGRTAADLIPDSRLELVPGAGHYPHEDDPERFAGVVTDFMATTRPRT